MSAELRALMVDSAVSTFAIYLFLILAIRVLGRRTLSQLNPLDLLVIMLLGSAVETAMVKASTSFKVGLVSGTILLLTNFLINRVLLRSRRLRHLVGGGPQLIVHNGKFVVERMRRLGLTEADVREALREREMGSLADARYVYVEPDGRINVVPQSHLILNDGRATAEPIT